MFEIYKQKFDPKRATDKLAWPERIEWDAPKAAGYRASDDLTHAVNVAIQLGKPLLLTGEPGTGKTQLAFSVAYQLNCFAHLHFDAVPLRFDTKSTSTAQDLFYSYDLLGRYADSRVEGTPKEKPEYLTINAMGIAILWTWNHHKYRSRIPEKFQRTKPCRAVVLIDEIDKAPRDFPNDILNEIEAFEFDISELSDKVQCKDKDWRPVVIITSNSEKNLPDAFLRRCVYHNIDFPSPEEIAMIVSLRLSEITQPDDANVEKASKLFFELRDSRPALQKKPGTAEYLNWLTIISKVAQNDKNFFRVENEEAVRKTLTALVKTQDDRREAYSVLAKWLQT